MLRRAADHLGKTSETGRLDAELLLAHALGRERIELYTDFDRPLTTPELDAYRELVARRARHEPVAYILGEWGFRRLTLTVDRRALIPRPETEIVVERALSHLSRARRAARARRRYRDGRDRARDRRRASGSARDRDRRLRPTRSTSPARTRARTGLAVELLAIRPSRTGFPAVPFDLVVSNPPYVEPADIETLMPDVREYEPHVALVGSGATEVVARAAVDVLAPGGWLVLEVGDGQALATAALLDGSATSTSSRRRT